MTTNQEMCYQRCPYNNVVAKFPIKIIVMTKIVMRGMPYTQMQQEGVEP